MATSSAVADLGKRLLEASRKGNAEEVRQLMANGAPITTDWLGTSPLHLAAQYGHTVTAEVLLRAGVSRDGKTKVDKTPLHLAAQQGHFEISQMLVRCGATVNATDMLIMTPLHWAVEAKSEGICKLLMEHGARTDIKNKFGRTAIDISKSKGYDNILKILISVAYVPHENGTKRLLKHEDSFFLDSKKRARTRKFPMTAGSWTVGEMQTAEKEERLRPKEPKTIFPNGEIQHESRQIKVISAEGSNLSSLIDAADIVRAKVKYPNNSNTDLSHKSNNVSASEPSVLDTLATLATASTQMATAVSDSNQQGHKVASLQNPAPVAPSYVTIPGIQGPVSIIQGNPNQPGIMQQGQVASALPPGMIQLASPLAFNILPGGRIQIGQSVIPGHSLGVPIQMPVQQTTGIPAGHVLAVSSGQSIAVVGGVPPGHIIPKPVSATDTTPSRQGVVMSPVSQGMTSILAPSTLSPNPQQLLSTTASSTYQNEVSRQGETRLSSSVNLGIQPNLISQQQQQQQPNVAPLAPSQLASAFQYANFTPGIAPIPLVPVAGIGGIQLVPQTMLQTHLLNAVRGGIPQSPGLGTVQPQVVTPGGAYTIPMSPLNLSSILPTALSLSQLPLSQQTINSLAQQSVVTSLSAQSVANALAQQSPGTQHIISSQPQGIVLQSDPHIQRTSQQQKRISIQNNQPAATSQASLSFTSGAQLTLGPIASQPHLTTVLAQQAFGAHQNITATGLQHGLGDPATLQALSGHRSTRAQGTPQSIAISSEQLARTTKAGFERTKDFHDSEKDNSLLANLTIAAVESRSPSLIVNSSHSPRIPISPGNFVRNEDEMRGISPSQISPTKSRGSAQSIFTESKESDHIHVMRSASPFNADTTSQSSLVKDNTTAPMLSGDHVLPHLQQLIYKQLLQQQQQHSQQQQQHPSQQESKAVKEDRNSRTHAHAGAEPHDFVNRSHGSPSDDFADEDRSRDQQNAHSEYFWRVMEQENPGLKRQLETDLDDELYDDNDHDHDDDDDDDEFTKERQERKSVVNEDDVTILLIKDENEEDLSSPPGQTDQTNDGDTNN